MARVRQGLFVLCTSMHACRSALLLLFAIICSVPDAALALEPTRPDQESSLTRAVFADGRVWVLSDAGDLSSIAEGQDVRPPERLPEKVLDLCVRGGRPAVITVAGDGSAWTLRERAQEVWSAVAVIPTNSGQWPNNDQWLAMDCSEGRITLLTSRRLINLDGNRQSSVALSGQLGRGWVASTYGTSDELFVGFNAGEWGGGLRRIDRRSGKITVLERNSTGELCGGPLNTECDPVTAIAADPWKPGCFVAAIGLVHFSPQGRLVEVCGNQVERLYFRPYGTARPPQSRQRRSLRHRRLLWIGAGRRLVVGGGHRWAPWYRPRRCHAGRSPVKL